MNLFRSEEHVKRWSLYVRAAEDYVMPVADWAVVFSGPMFRCRLDADYLDHADEYLRQYHDDLHELGKTSPLWQYPLIERMEVVDVARYQVVGNYTRFEPAVLNTLKDARNRIVAGIDSTAPRRENHLVWAAPGSGKTYLVEEIARSLGGRSEYVELNLARIPESAFRTALAEVTTGPGPTLCLIDEVDSRPGEAWPYESLMPHLDATSEGRAHVVFVLAGSSGFSLEGMKQRIGGRPKGTDVLSRVPVENQFVIAPMTFGDRILVVLAQFLRAAELRGTEVRDVEKLGLFYVASSSQLANARQLQEFAVRAVARVPPGDDRIKYDHLFEPGDPANKRFWLDVANVAGGLVDTYVHLAG